jgi:hypothetical protein
VYRIRRTEEAKVQQKRAVGPNKKESADPLAGNDNVPSKYTRAV